MQWTAYGTGVRDPVAQPAHKKELLSKYFNGKWMSLNLNTCDISLSAGSSF